MSIVGPRPPVANEGCKICEMAEKDGFFHDDPGLTPLAGQRQEATSVREWMRLDLQYIDNWSLKLDAKIILKTIPLLFGRGAY